MPAAPVALPDFNDLTDAEKRAVAERILKVQESGWKPFWCRNPNCDGMPHRKMVGKKKKQKVHYVGVAETEGPNGEPLGDVETNSTGKVLGRPVLDPEWAHNHARKDQRLPPWQDPWTLFIMSGRGAGKTRTGVEFVTLCARKGLTGAIIGRRGTELENTHVAEILAHAHPEFTPVYFASKDILVWPEVTLKDGSKTTPITYLFSAERPENIRSVNLSYTWFDEAAFMDEIETAWMNARMATRVRSPGNPLHTLITSTPTSTPWVMKREDDPDVEIRRVSTYANKANLDDGFLADLRKQYEGTRMGRQEIHGEVLRDVEGALWNDDMLTSERIEDPVAFADLIDSLDDRVVAVDPAGSKTKRSDETGIIGVGVVHTDEHGEPLPVSTFSVLADATIKGSPTEWARQTYKVARLIKANRIIAEKNFGGDMVKQVLMDFATKYPNEAHDADGEPFRIVVRHTSQSKETRAEATVGKYEQGRVKHITSTTAFGDLSTLEREQVTWVPKSRGGKLPSPNRVDALVWGVRECDSVQKHGVQQATSSSVMAKMKRTGGGRRY